MILENSKEKEIVMKRFLSFALVFLLALTLLVGCSSTKSYTFRVATGDNIKITLDTSSGLDLVQDNGQFAIKSGDETIFAGAFIEADTYTQYIDSIHADGGEAITVISEDGYGVFYTVNGSVGVEYDYITFIDGGNTGILMGSVSSQANAEAALACITFELA